MNITFTQDEVVAIESPLSAIEGSTLTPACTFWGVPSSVSAAVYRNQSSTAVTSTVMPSGSVSVSGNIATLKPMTAMVGGSRYTVAVTATVNGDVWVRKFTVIVSKDETE